MGTEEERRVINEVARFLSFFKESRIYAPIDKMARPFSYDDVVSALQEAVREAVIAKENAVEVGEGEQKRRVVQVRDKKVPEPYIPSRSTLEKFLELCKRDLTYSREAALLALAFGG